MSNKKKNTDNTKYKLAAGATLAAASAALMASRKTDQAKQKKLQSTILENLKQIQNVNSDLLDLGFISVMSSRTVKQQLQNFQRILNSLEHQLTWLEDKQFQKSVHKLLDMYLTNVGKLIESINFELKQHLTVNVDRMTGFRIPYETDNKVMQNILDFTEVIIEQFNTILNHFDIT